MSDDLRRYINMIAEKTIQVPGVGVYSQSTLNANLREKMDQLAAMVSQDNWESVYNMMFENPAFKQMMKTYVQAINDRQT